MENIAAPEMIIVDLEATCWDRNDHDQREAETIEIGALKVEPTTRRVTDEFHSLIRPVRHEVLSDYCRGLTNISQEEVDAAQQFPVVWQQFIDWSGDFTKVRLASWGSYDPKQLQQDCSFHRLAYPFDSAHINIKKLFSAHTDGRKYGMTGALRQIGLELEGRHHRALDDARNIFRIWCWIESTAPRQQQNR